MRLKIKHPARPATELAPSPPAVRPSPLTGFPPPVEHQFKPGKDWKGNAGGRPKLIGKTLEQKLLEEVGERVIPDPEDPTKKITVKIREVDKVVESLISNAKSPEPHSVSAFRTIRDTIEPIGEVTDRGSFDAAREILILMIERGKHMEIRDI